MLAFLLLASVATPAMGADAEGDIGSFSAAGVFPEDRRGVAATSLADGRVLFVGGDVEAEAAGASAYRWDPIDQTFAPAGSLDEPRLMPTATLLQDGRVLVIGGLGGPARDLIFLDSAETWDPASASFSRTGSPRKPRAAHTATLLADGRVLVVSGFLFGDSEFETRASAEIWDPATEVFNAAASLPVGRVVHTATLLQDGRVLVVGGVDGDEASLRASAVLWDPATESFGPSGALQSGRAHHSATPLPDGAVLIVGGDGDAGTLHSAEMWDPATGVFYPAGSLALGRSDHTATLLADGRVLIAGGSDYNGMFTASAEVWSPTSSVGSGE